MTGTTSDTSDDAEILVLERTDPRYRWAKRGIEAALKVDSGDSDVARWLASPDTGRFLVLDYLETEFEFMVRNVETVDELIDLMRTKAISHLMRDGRLPRFASFVSPDVDAAIHCLKI